MDFIRQQWNLIQERLAGLAASQKMLIGALVVITIMTMLYLGRFASNRQMVALNSVPMSAEEVATATASLRARGIGFTTSGSTIMVSADDQMAALGDLSFNQALPTSPNFFESMFEKVSVFGTQGDFNARLNNARERTIASMISNWPDVKSANVLIQDSQHRGIGRFEPRATVNISTRSGSGVKKLGQSATMIVLGAVSGLSRANVTVTIDGVAMSNNNADGVTGVGNEAFELIRQFEIATAEKIRGTFVQFIPSIVVAVTAEVETKTMKEILHKVDPSNKVVIPTKSTTETLTTNEAPASGEPGAGANVGMDIQPVNGPMAGTSSEKTVEENDVSVGKSETEILTPAGKAKIVGAAVRVPRSYFVNYWRAANRKADGEPSDAEYTAIAEREITKIRDDVKRLTAIADEALITVAEYPDLELPASTGGATSSSGVTLFATTYAKEGAIGVLALASLFMVSRIVKKSVPAPTVALAGVGSVSAGSFGGSSASSARPRTPAKLESDEELAGDVAEAGQVLMGQELDPAALETAQMVDQVSKYVKDNPDTAANLVRRLMARE